MGNLRLSEAITEEELREITKSEQNKFFIIAGVGAGKNYFVENILKEYGNILYITSRRAKVDEILMNNLCSESINWELDTGDITTLTNAGVELIVKHQRFGRTFPEILTHYDFIVVDEAHSIFTDATYTTSSFHVKSFLEYAAATAPKMKVILMTGTPEPIPDDFLKGYRVINKLKECINVVPAEIKLITFEEALNIMECMSENEKTIYFSNSGSRMLKGDNSIYQKLLSSGQCADTDFAFCMSPKTIEKYKNDIAELEDKVTFLRSYISTNNRLPEEVRILLTTSTLKEGINIEYGEKKIKYAFCESHLLSELQQFAGRIRDGLETLYVIEDAKQHSVFDNELKAYRLDFHFSEHTLLKAINSYFESIILDDDSEIYEQRKFNAKDIFIYDRFYKGEYSLHIFQSEAANEFIKFIESRNPYIRFNYTTGKFHLYSNRLFEQRRVNEKLDHNKWDEELDLFAKENGIKYISIHKKDESLINELNELLNGLVDERIWGNDRGRFRDYLSNKLSLKINASDTTINNALSRLGIKFALKVKSTTVEGKSKRYLTIIRTANKRYLSAQELKWYIYSNNLIPFVLENIGCTEIKYHRKREYYSCANWNGDNPTAINVYNNKWLNVTNWTRPNAFPKGSDIFTLVMYNKGIDFKGASKYFHSILKLSDDAISELDFSKMSNDCYEEEESDELYIPVIIDERELEKYTPRLHIFWLREGIMQKTRDKFDIRFSDREKRIVIPIRKWDDGSLIGFNKRTTVEHYEEFGIKKYLITPEYKKSYNLYGLWENRKEIEKMGYCTIFESEKSVLKRDTFLDPSGVAIQGKWISDEQRDIVLSLNISEVIIALDADVSVNEVRCMAEKFYGKIKVSYMYDTTGLLGAKDSPADLTRSKYQFMFDNRIEYNEAEHKMYLDSLKRT